MSLSEIKNAVDGLSDAELLELATFIRRREDAAWDRQIDTDFAEGDRLRSVLDEVRADLLAGGVSKLREILEG